MKMRIYNYVKGKLQITTIGHKLCHDLGFSMRRLVVSWEGAFRSKEEVKRALGLVLRVRRRLLVL